MITKSVLFDTRVPDNYKNLVLQNQKFGIDLFQIIEGVSTAAADKPVTRFAWDESIEDFTYDLSYSNARKSEMDEIKREVAEKLNSIHEIVS